MAEYMWWADKDKKKATVRKINEGLEYFLEKYGQLPEEVVVNPAELVSETNLGVKINRVQNVGLNNFWIGPLSR